MHFSFALISLLVLFPGAFITLSLAVFGRKHGDAGTPYLLFPMLVLFLLTFLELLRLLGELLIVPSVIRPPILLLEDADRIVLSFSWVFVCHKHYVLNGVVDLRWKITPVFAVVAAASMALLVVSRLRVIAFPADTLIDLQVASFLFYAAIAGLVLLWKKSALLRSSRVILAVAGISLVVYPLVSLADVFRFSYPGLDAGVPIWMQTQPFYYALVCIPMFHYIRCRFLAAGGPAAPAVPGPLDDTDLTEREKAIVSLLLQGKTYKDISRDLHITLATVKTHVNKAYGKLGVQSRSQLQALLSGK